jgi:PST family polysaccharide transporter
MSLRQKAIKGIIWSVIQSWGRQAISFIVFAALARLLDPEAFGLVALASVFLAFVQVFLDQGFVNAIIQREELHPEHLDTAFWTNLGIGAVLTVLGFFLGEPVSRLFGESQLTPIIQCLSLTFLFSALINVQEAIFRRNLNFKALAVRELLAVSIGGCIGIISALSGLGVWSLVNQQLVSSLVQVFVLWLASDWRPKLSFSIKHFKDLFFFGVNVIGINFLNFFNTRSDDLLIGYFLGSVALGYYSIAYRLLQVVTQLIIGVINGLAMPIFSRLQKEPEKLHHAFYKGIHFSSLIAFPVFLGLSVLAPELIVVLFGEKWIPSIPVMQILNLVGVLYAGFYFNSPMLMAIGKPNWQLGLTFIQAICNVTAFAIAVRWGIVAVAAAYAIRSYLMAPFTIWLVQKLTQISIKTYLHQYTAPLIGSLAMSISIIGIRHFSGNILSPNIFLLVSITFGSVLYLATISQLDSEFIREMKELFYSMSSKSIKRNSQGL